METIGIIGAGAIGSNVAELAVRHGHPVVLSNSRGPDTLTELVERLGPLASADTPAGAAAAASVVVLATPLTAVATLPVAELRSRILVDAGNYDPDRDGPIDALDDGSITSSGWLQAQLPQTQVVKAFQQIHAPQIVTDALPAGSPDRRALAVFGDDPQARQAVVDLIDAWGFDALDAGDLSDSWRLERDTPAWNSRDTLEELRAHLAETQRRG